MGVPELSTYKFSSREARLFKVLVRVESLDDLKVLTKIVRGFMKREGRPQYVVLFKYLNHQQVAALKRQYGGKLNLILVK